MKIKATISKDELIKIITEHLATAGMRIEGKIAFDVHMDEFTGVSMVATNEPDFDLTFSVGGVSREDLKGPFSCNHEWRPTCTSDDKLYFKQFECRKCGKIQ